MPSLAFQLPEFLGDDWRPWLRGGLLVFVGLPLVFTLAAWLGRLVSKRSSPQWGLIAGKVVRYLGMAVVTVLIIDEFGFSLTPLLGAAGIAGVALAFASQTSVSNIISGFFLIAERPFEVGDLITVGGTTGFVLSIDTLSVKLRTFDNCYVRLPNETLVKSEITNITRYPIRRIDLLVSVAYREDMERVREVLLGIADAQPLCLIEPRPKVMFTGFGASSIDFKLAAWVARENYLELKNALADSVKATFDREGIEIPFPHLSLYAGSETGRFPLDLAKAAPGAKSEPAVAAEKPQQATGDAQEESP